MMSKYLNRSIAATAKGSVKRVCVLKPMEAEQQIIYLNSGMNVLGRSKETGIRDSRCSKQQLELNVNLDQGRIKMKVVGVNPSSVNGFMALKDTECELMHGDILEVVYGRHQFEVTFKPIPTIDTEERENSAESSSAQAASADAWDSVENGKMMVFTSAGVVASDKIAAYDMDGTIITTKSGNVFPKNTDDWKIIYSEVPKKLKSLQQSGYKICFFTNQGGIAKGKIKVDDFKGKVRQIVKSLKVPVQVFIAIEEGYYRKPLPGMWEHLIKYRNDGIKIHMARSFFVGDAAGRLERGSGINKRKKDHSLADRFFAGNIGVSFYTPEEHFLGIKIEENWDKPNFEPSTLHDKLPLFETNNVVIPSENTEMIIMVGLPGSGKSHFCRENLAALGYIVANGDKLGGTQACLKVCAQALSAGKSCVVDNTNVDVESRNKFKELAYKHKVPCRCFLMNVSLEQVKHNLVYRKLTDTSHSNINEMIFNTMKKKYREPSLDEGFTQIIKVNLRPKFNTVKHEELYKLYLVEKYK